MINDILTLPKVIFQNDAISEKSISDYSTIVIILNDFCEENIKELPFGEVLFKRLEKSIKPDSMCLTTVLPNEFGSQVILFRTNKTDSFTYLTSLRKELQKYPQLGEKVSLIDLSNSTPSSKEVLRSLFAMALNMPCFKSKQDKDKKLHEVHCYTKEFDTTGIESATQGNAIARYLSALPKNYLSPSLYIKFLKKLAAKQNWGYEFYSKKKLASLKANAFLAVARASQEAGIVHLKYKPESNTHGKCLALVGKGVCYDTGGINVKPDQYMFGMQEDMQGSSVALGTFYMLTQLKVPYEIDCWLAITENNISADCYTPNEVVTASNGLTIEVVHTDAEGRMILADTLVLASKKKPDLLIDYATLTGASIKAVGKKYASVFTTDYDLNAKLIKAGQQSGERVWPFPMTDDYDENIKSDIADIQQCNLQGGPDHIDAARFLSKFVGDSIKWVHIDLAAAMDNKGGLGAIPTASTGFGVWFTKEFLDDYFNAKV